jgi:hypothetical protein
MANLRVGDPPAFLTQHFPNPEADRIEQLAEVSKTGFARLGETRKAQPVRA